MRTPRESPSCVDYRSLVLLLVCLIIVLPTLAAGFEEYRDKCIFRVTY